jgi:hypothetical protein
LVDVCHGAENVFDILRNGKRTVIRRVDGCHFAGAGCHQCDVCPRT